MVSWSLRLEPHCLSVCGHVRNSLVIFHASNLRGRVLKLVYRWDVSSYWPVLSQRPASVSNKQEYRPLMRVEEGFQQVNRIRGTSLACS